MNFLTGATTAVTAADWQAVMDALTAQISVSSVVGVLAILVGAATGLAFMWWGVRKLIAVIMKAFMKGKVSV